MSSRGRGLSVRPSVYREDGDTARRRRRGNQARPGIFIIHADLLTKHLDNPLYTFHRNLAMNIDLGPID